MMDLCLKFLPCGFIYLIKKKCTFSLLDYSALMMYNKATFLGLVSVEPELPVAPP